MQILTVATIYVMIHAVKSQFGFPNQFFGGQQFGNLGNFQFPGPVNTPNYQQPFPQNSQQRPPQNFQQRPQQNPQQRPQQNPQQRPPQNRPQRPGQNQQKPSQNPQKPIQSSPNILPGNERISETKCREYTSLLQNTVSVASLSIEASPQNIAIDKCDSTTPLVVGGVDARLGEFPHMAALGYAEDFGSGLSFKCGGTLISDRYVLTAAHCKTGRTVPSIVRLGELNLARKDPTEVDYTVAEFISHEKYNTKTSHNDIAVIRVTESVRFNKYIRPACLGQLSTVIKPKAIASGWGFTEVGGNTADILQKVELTIIDTKKCNELYNDPENYDIDSTQICAGELAGGKDTCGGDSGGPLQIASERNKCMYVVLGIVSYGTVFCGARNSPGVYTKVSSYIDWIEAKVWGKQTL